MFLNTNNSSKGLFSPHKFCFLLLAIFSLAGFTASAQPDAATIQKDIDAFPPLVKSFALTGKPPILQKDPETGKMAWKREVALEQNSQVRGLLQKARGYAVYEKNGNAYQFQEYQQQSNQLDGIKQVTMQDLLPMLKDDWSGFYGSYYNRIFKIESPPAFTDDPYILWHNPRSLRVHIKVKYSYISTDTDLETIDQIFQVQFYRDDPTGNWTRFNSNVTESPENKTHQILHFNKLQILQMYKKTLPYQGL
jgi:hypothetical protein